MQKIIARANKIKAAIFDVDGVLTDGQLHLTENQQEYKTFHVHDGMGIKMLLQNNIHVAIISSRCSPIVERRMQDLGVKHIYQGIDNKLHPYQGLLQQLQLQDDEIAYTGDDLPDLIIMRRVGLAIAVANAVAEVQHQAHWITSKAGGHGAGREVCELLLTAQDKLKTLTS